ncbi:hypothetical protein [Nocardioides sp. YIM 152315]|uniref:hypothetical protein n=1 Tax=Nocardioides sp. YIM 152315 TaxID=3031760 RepID=UPI0023DC34E2|nr:hypothetical protein [Nocardioides sp. YIM 152315]MDF1603356.1 hypothetical protein [Nocardioides sp. YIM 152315]
MSNELPGRWGELLAPKGIHSYRDLAAKIGVSHGTAHRLVTGGKTSPETINRAGDALFGGDRNQVLRLRGSARRDYGDWSLPPEASQLTEEQRRAILAVVRAMLPAETEEGGGGHDDEQQPGGTAPTRHDDVDVKTRRAQHPLAADRRADVDLSDSDLRR